VPTPTPGDALLVVRKWIDIDGRVETTDAPDRLAAPAWPISVTITGGTPTTAAGTTDDTGTISFVIRPGGDRALVDVREALPEGVRLMEASCVAADEERGRAKVAGGVIRDVPIAAGETVTCTFVNTSGGVSPVTPRPTAPTTSGLPADDGEGGGDLRVVIVALVALIALLELLAPARLLRILAR
jgi:hypothetical protein